MCVFSVEAARGAGKREKERVVGVLTQVLNMQCVSDLTGYGKEGM